MSATVELDAVGKVFHLRRGDVVALRGIDLTLGTGEILGLVGPNGAGKTVLVKLIATLTEPSSGSVRVLGLDAVRDGRAIRRLVGLATCDERSFYWRLTAQQNLMFFARLHGFGRRSAQGRIDELFDRLDLRPLRDRPYRTLSAGNRQRLAIARALLCDPPILLLDEPTSSLDPIAARNLRRLVRERLVADARRSVLFTTHDLAEVEELCSRVAILHRGELLECAELSALRARYDHGERVTITLGRPPLNGALAGIGRRLRDFACDDGVSLHFSRAAGDGDLHTVLAELVGAGARIVGCRTQVGDLTQLFDNIVARRERG